MVIGAAAGTAISTCDGTTVLCIRWWPYNHMCWSAQLWHCLCVHCRSLHIMYRYRTVSFTDTYGLGITFACTVSLAILFVIGCGLPLSTQLLSILPWISRAHMALIWSPLVHGLSMACVEIHGLAIACMDTWATLLLRLRHSIQHLWQQRVPQITSLSVYDKFREFRRGV